MIAYLKCNTNKGMFSSERSVIVDTVDGQMSFFADKRDIWTFRGLERDQEAIKVRIVASRDDLSVVEFPYADFFVDYPPYYGSGFATVQREHLIMANNNGEPIPS